MASLRGARPPDRALIEDALNLLLNEAPSGWSTVRAEFEFAATPMPARAWAATASGEQAIAVPAEAIALVTQYRRQTAGGAQWLRLTVDCDSSGTVAMRTDPPAVPARRPEWFRIGLAGAAAAASIGVMTVAIVARPHGGGPSLRPIAAEESMTDAEALAVATSTVRVWMRERNQRHAANLEALSCPETQDGALAREISAVKRGDSIDPVDPALFGTFLREGPLWSLDTFHMGNRGGEVFYLRVRNGELLVCNLGSAPPP